MAEIIIPPSSNLPAIPDIPPDPDETWWSNRFRRSFAHKFDVIVSIGGDIRRFHDQVLRDPVRFGPWLQACLRVVGYDNSTCSQYETVYRVFGGELEPHIKTALPARIYTLYLLAKAVQSDRHRVEAAITSGLITSAMTQKQAKMFLDETLMIEEVTEEVREVKEAKKPLTVRTYPDDMIKRKVETDIATMRQLYGDAFLQVVKMRRDFAEVFGVIQKWDTSFESKDVTVLLKLLLDE